MSKKLTNIIAIALMIIGAALGIYTWVATSQAEGIEAQVAAIDPIFIWIYILVAIAVLALIIVPLPYMIRNPKTMVKFGIGIVALGVVLLIAYMLSSDAALPFIEGAADKNEWSTWADVNIISMYIMTGAAILVIALSGVMGIFKSNK